MFHKFPILKEIDRILTEELTRLGVTENNFNSDLANHKVYDTGREEYFYNGELVLIIEKEIVGGVIKYHAMKGGD